MSASGLSVGSNFIDLEAQLPYEGRFSQNSDEPELPAPLRLATSIDRFDHLTVFRRFGDLNILSILCLQAELLHLQSKLVSQSTESVAGRTLQQASEDAGIDLQPFLDLDGERTSELDILEEIRGKMLKYSLCPQAPTRGFIVQKH